MSSDWPAPVDAPTPEDPEGPVSAYAVSPESTRREFLAAAKLYAREVVDAHGLTVAVDTLNWEVSARAKRRAGAVKHCDGTPETVSLTWDFFAEKGWEQTTEIVRHELAHVHLLNEADDGGHGPAFEALAERLRAPRHCERFVGPAWWVRCVDCSVELARYRASKLVEHPERYACGACGGRLRVERNE